MDHKKIRAIGAGVLVALWIALTGFGWFGPAKEMSEAERRPLDQMPAITLQSILDGKFMADFESFTLDQFPLRDTFRQTKALFHRYILAQRDNNEIYYTDGHFSKLDYPVDTASVSRATGIFNRIYKQYLEKTNCKVYMAAIPDKGYYLGAQNGFPVMDYEEMFALLQQQMPCICPSLPSAPIFILWNGN